MRARSIVLPLLAAAAQLRRAGDEEPFTWTNWPEAWDADEEPPPSGLLGPVILAPSPGVFPEARPADRKPPTNEPATP